MLSCCFVLDPQFSCLLLSAIPHISTAGAASAAGAASPHAEETGHGITGAQVTILDYHISNYVNLEADIYFPEDQGIVQASHQSISPSVLHSFTRIDQHKTLLHQTLLHAILVYF